MSTANSNLKKRVIPLILLSNYQVVKSREFKDYRVFGNLEQTITVFNNRNVDEIIVLDIDASKYKSKINLELLEILSKNCLMPFSYGGGIQSSEDIKKCLLFGCEKVVINSKCINDISFISKMARIFGRQCLVVSVDYEIVEKNKWKVYSHAGLKTDKLDLKKYLLNLANEGAGELILTAVNKEGNMGGYDTTLYENICKEIDIPIILNGGCGNPKHIKKPFALGADGCGASSIFYYTQYSYKDIKDYLVENKISVRPS